MLAVNLNSPVQILLLFRHYREEANKYSNVVLRVEQINSVTDKTLKWHACLVAAAEVGVESLARLLAEELTLTSYIGLCVDTRQLQMSQL